MTLALVWAVEDAARDAAAGLLAGEMRASPAYIAHSEIQEGLSDDGRDWSVTAAELAEDYRAWLRERPDVSVLVAGDPAPLGVAVVVWDKTAAVPFATILDMAVTGAARSQGVGARLMAMVEAEARARGISWLFLESGVRNHRAHDFFEAAGFKPLSHVFGKPLTPPA